MPDITKLEWLRQAKRDLVSEADPNQQYDIDNTRRLGKGGFGEVYYAKHRETGEEVCFQMKITVFFTIYFVFVN